MLEIFEPGALDKTMRENAAGVRLFSTHETRSRQPIGSVRKHESREDGLHVWFSLNNTSDGRDARELVRTGDATGLSVGFYPVRSYDREENGVTTIIRKEAKLDHVALVHRPAYPDAQVASVRAEEEVEPEPTPTPQPEPEPEPEPEAEAQRSEPVSETPDLDELREFLANW